MSCRTLSWATSALLAILLSSRPTFGQAAGPELNTGGDWSERFHFTGAGTEDRFGSHVACPGDVNADGVPDILVTAPGWDPNHGSAELGAAYVYSGDDGRPIWILRDPERLGYFAGSASHLGDVDQDGHADLLIGSPRWSRIYVFSGRTGLLLYQLEGPDDLGEQLLGIGDIDLDGAPDFLAVSEESIYGGGSVFAFSGADGAMIHQNYYNGATALATAGDIDLDGVPDYIYSSVCPCYGDRNGRVFHISGATGATIRTDYPDSQGCYYGQALAGVGDVSGDGLGDYAVRGDSWTPERESRVDIRSGSVHGFWQFLRILRNREQDENFGSVLIGLGDVDGDGLLDVGIGDPTWPYTFRGAHNPTRRGAVYIYTAVNGALVNRMVSGRDLTRFGSSLATADFNGDGRGDLVVGSPGRLAALGGGGEVLVLESFEPHIAISNTTVTQSEGGTVTIDLDFPASEAGNSYAILACNAHRGTGPSRVGAVTLPLTSDMVLEHAKHGYPLPGASGLQGFLDQNGDAQAVVIVAPYAYSTYVWLYIAALTSTAEGRPSEASSAVSIQVRS